MQWDGYTVMSAVMGVVVVAFALVAGIGARNGVRGIMAGLKAATSDVASAGHDNRVRAYALVTLLVGLLVSLSACSSSGSSSSPQASESLNPGALLYPGSTDSGGPAIPDFSGDPGAGSDTASPSPAPSDLTDVGVQTLAGASGDTVTTALSVGKPSDFAAATVPDDAISTCAGWSDPTAQANATIIPGALTITYQGNVPQFVGIGAAPGVVQLTKYNLGADQSQVGTVAVHDVSGTGWDLCSSGSIWSDTMQPGESVTVDLYLFLGLKTNAHPTVTEDDLRSLTLNIGAAAGDQSGVANAAATFQVSGPQAASCTNVGRDGPALPVLLLFAKPPQVYDAPDYNAQPGRLNCRPAR